MLYVAWSQLYILTLQKMQQPALASSLNVREDQRTKSPILIGFARVCHWFLLSQPSKLSLRVRKRYIWPHISHYSLLTIFKTELIFGNIVSFFGEILIFGEVVKKCLLGVWWGSVNRILSRISSDYHCKPLKNWHNYQLTQSPEWMFVYFVRLMSL